MNFKIYQAYYRQDQISELESNFCPLDNTENPYPELREHYVNKLAYDRATQEGIDFWGVFSWKYKQKLPDVPSELIIKLVKQAINDNADVFIVNPWPEHVCYTYNVWEQGEWCHPGMMRICEELFPKIGLDIGLLYTPMDQGYYVLSHFYLGNQKFWRQWIELIDNYIKAVPTLSPEIQNLHNSSAGYPEDLSLNYFPFIVERLASTFLLTKQKEFNITSVKVKWEEMHPIINSLQIMKNSLSKYGGNESILCLKGWHALRNEMLALKQYGNLDSSYTDFAAEMINKYSEMVCD